MLFQPDGKKAKVRPLPNVLDASRRAGVRIPQRQVQAAVTLPASVVNEGDLLAQLVRQYTGADFTGNVEIDARINANPSGVYPSMMLAIDNGVLDWSDGAQRVEGVSSRVIH